MKEFFKIAVIYLTRFFTRFLFVFPVKKNRVCFISFGGRGYTCCPKYIFQELQKKYASGFEYIWLLRNPEKTDVPGIKVVKCKYLSIKYFYYLATAKYIFSNYSMITRPPLRKNQIFVNTWHGGGAYKKVGLTNIVSERKRTDLTFNILAKETSYFISSSRIFTEVMAETMRMPKEKFIEIGMPRNDIFFTDYSDKIQKVKNFYNIPSDSKILLYAPTYRGESGNLSENVQLDVSLVISATEKRFGGKFVCMYRGHYYIHDKIVEGTINASDYPDMQELLCAADVLITDFSSSMWDFGLTGKTCFLFVPDLLDYSTTREFYTPIDKWGFPYAVTNHDLVKVIENFDNETYRKSIEENHACFGTFEKGTACKNLLTKLNL